MGARNTWRGGRSRNDCICVLAALPASLYKQACVWEHWQARFPGTYELAVSMCRARDGSRQPKCNSDPAALVVPWRPLAPVLHISGACRVWRKAAGVCVRRQVQQGSVRTPSSALDSRAHPDCLKAALTIFQHPPIPARGKILCLWPHAPSPSLPL